MIVVTGAAGFIGSNLVKKLNDEGIGDIILVDEFTTSEKEANYQDKKFLQKIDRELFPEWFENTASDVSFVFHIGARTDTTELNNEIFEKLNLKYSMKIWNTCSNNDIPLLYASSAATYGDGIHGYRDDFETSQKIKPMNPYGWSKHNFDRWANEQDRSPKRWYGLKFFNVYGPNEYHKGRMASVVMHAFKQIAETGKVKLFRSHKSDYEDGKQLRDFIYVEDVLNVVMHFFRNEIKSGIYNVGTGKAATFIDLVTPIFDQLSIPVDIDFIDIPSDIRETYQYFTEADTEKLRSTGFTNRFIPVEEGVSDYVAKYLKEHKYS